MAAEINPGYVDEEVPPGASMRPRRMAAEIAARARPLRRTPGRFNEAAANGRGNRCAKRWISKSFRALQ